jgi:hypothetical protein
LHTLRFDIESAKINLIKQKEPTHTNESALIFVLPIISL